MKREFEVISHSQLGHINVFLVHLTERAVHLHRDLETGLVLEGRVTLSVEHREERIDAGELYLIDPMEPHEFYAGEDGALILAIQLSPQLAETWYPDAAGIRFDCPFALGKAYADMPRRYALLKAVCVELAFHYLKRAKNFEFRCFALVSLLLQRLTEDLPWEALSDEDSLSERRRAERLFEITDYIEHNFRRKLLLGEIARREGLSLSYLSHFFKDSMGVTFQEYLNQIRFEHACRLLELTERSILDISLESGFSDVRYFNRMFAAHYGCSPSVFRAGGGSGDLNKGQISGSQQHFYTPEEALEKLAPVRSSLLESVGKLRLDRLFQSVEV